jgi:hypothetical protein
MSLSEPSYNTSGVLVWDLAGGVFTSLSLAPCPRLVSTQVQIQVCLRRQKGSLINFQQRHLSNPLFWG